MAGILLLTVHGLLRGKKGFPAERDFQRDILFLTPNQWNLASTTSSYHPAGLSDIRPNRDASHSTIERPLITACPLSLFAVNGRMEKRLEI